MSEQDAFSCAILILDAKLPSIWIGYNGNMKNLIKYISVCFSLVGCMSSQGNAYSYTGEQINNKFKKLQTLTLPFEYEDGRISEKESTIYRIKK